MKICIVTDSYPPNIGGAELAVGHLARRLARQGWLVVVITAAPEKQVVLPMQSDLVTVIQIKVPRTIKRFWFGIRAIWTVLSEGKNSDVIQGTTYGGALPSIIAAKLLNKPCILLVHELIGPQWFRFEPNWLKAAFYYLTEKTIVRLPFAKFIAVSEYTKSMILRLGAPSQKVEVVHHGMEQERFTTPLRMADDVREELGLNPGDFLYVAYGRTGITKGFDFFAKAVPLIYERLPCARFLFVLTKHDPRIWKRIQNALAAVPKNVCQVLETLPRIRLFELLAAADCVVIPSLSEGFGFTAIEACSLNKRVVITSAGALPEVVFGHHVIVEPGSERALADGCIRAFEGETRYMTPKNFDWGKTVAKYNAIYEEVLRKKN